MRHVQPLRLVSALQGFGCPPSLQIGSHTAGWAHPPVAMERHGYTMQRTLNWTM